MSLHHEIWNKAKRKEYCRKYPRHIFQIVSFVEMVKVPLFANEKSLAYLFEAFDERDGG